MPAVKKKANFTTEKFINFISIKIKDHLKIIEECYKYTIFFLESIENYKTLLASAKVYFQYFHAKELIINLKDVIA
tara:strand:+ start:157 stop:384 length:228 start_codon:yes stop_codon:yes gene_type:complete